MSTRRAALIADEWGGIYPLHEAFYIHSIIYSASRAGDAFQRFDIARAVNDTEENQVSAVQEALGHAGALSRFFWPSGLRAGAAQPLKRLRAARATKLRAAFNLTDESPLRDRNLRDSLEHFDERLDSYLLTNDAGYFFPLARIGRAELATQETAHIFKLVDPATSSFVCLGMWYDFGLLRREVARVHELAVAMDEVGGRLPHQEHAPPGT